MEFAEFYQATSPRTLRYAYGLTGDLALAQDVVQEAYVRAWQRWRKLSGYDDAEAWLRLVVSRLVFDWWRHLRVRRTTALQPPAPVDGPSEETVLVVAALKKLPDRQRKALALHYLLDMPVARIATEMEVSEGTVKSWLSRGRDSLAALLKDELAGVPLADAGAVEELGRRRRRTRVAATVTAAGLAVLAVVWLAAAVLGRDRTMPPPPTVAPTGSPMAFSPLRTIGSVALPPQTQGVQIADGRAFSVSYAEGTMTVSAFDLATAKAAWPPVTLPKPGEDAAGVLAWSDAVMVFAPNGTTVIDPATGAIRWHLDRPTSSDRTMVYPGIAVFADPQSATTSGVDLRTGVELWRITGANRQIFGVVSAADLATADYGTGSRPFSLLSGGPLLIADGAGTVTEYDVTTGEPTGRVWRGVPPADGYLAYNGDIFVQSAREVYRIHLADGRQTVVYQGSGVSGIVPCGAVDVCFGDSSENGGQTLVALHDGHVKWTAPVPRAMFMAPVGHLLRVTISLDEDSRLYNEQGQEVLRLTGSTRLVRLDAGNLLLVKLSDDGASATLTGICVAGLKQTPLGTVKIGPGSQPVADGSILVSTADGRLTVYHIS